MQGGSGKAIFTNGSTLTITTGNNKFFNRSVDLYTSNAVWSAGLLYSGGTATFTIKPGAIFDIAGDQIAPFSSYINYLTCVNQGLVLKSTGSGGASLTWIVDNSGTVSALNGLLDLAGGGSSSGNFNAAASATVNFGGLTQTLNGGANFSGGGLHRIQNGQLDFNTDLVVGTLFELGISGTLSGNSNVTFSSAFNWSGGTMQGGAGKAIFTNGSTLSITTGNNKFFNRSVDLYTSNAVWSAGLLYSGGAATFSIKPGAIFDMAGDLIAPYSSYVNYLTCMNQGLVR